MDEAGEVERLQGRKPGARERRLSSAGPWGLSPTPHTPPSGLALHPVLADEEPGSSAARLTGLLAPWRGPHLSLPGSLCVLSLGILADLRTSPQDPISRWKYGPRGAGAPRPHRLSL